MSGTRRLRMALAGGLVAVLIAVVLGWRTSPKSVEDRNKRPHPVGRGEVAEGEESRIVNGDIESQNVKAAWRTTEPDGTTRFHGSAEAGPVKVTLGYTADGKRDKVTIEAAKGEYHPTTQSGRFEGAVKVETGLGVELSTDTLVYRGQEAIAESDDTVQFRRKQIAGSARGVRLAIRDGALTLNADVKMHIDDAERGALEITAARGAFEKKAGDFELLGGVTVRQGESVLTAERLTGSLALPGYVLRLLEASGNVVLVSPGAAMGRQMGLNASSGSCKLTAARLDMPVGAPGARRELHVGPGGFDFVWWSGHQGEEKRLQANAATFVLDATGRIESVAANKNVRLIQGATPAAKGRVATAGDLVTCGTGTVSLDPQTREITKGELDRGVVMTRGPMRAAAEHGVLEESQLVLTGSPEVANAESGTRLSGDSIQIGMGPKRGSMAAWGNITHTFRRWRSGDSGEASLVTIKANEMAYDENKYSGMYRGDALLRMGADEVSARQILVRGSERALKLFAKLRVVSRFSMRNKDGSAADVVEGRAGSLSYNDFAGQLAYEGGVTFRQGDLGIETPDKLALQLSPERTLKDLSAGGAQVTLALGARRATGVSLTYSGADESFRLLGDPVAYEDGDGTAGRGLALTLRKAEDRIQIDGRDLQRTETTIKRGQPQR
jgi:lipopolysaccharide export system protein LptA